MIFGPVVLASSSPRRLELLKLAGLNPIVRPAELDESPQLGEDPATMAERLAQEKRDAVATPGERVIAADTVVVLDDAVLGKPGTAEIALAMLRRLSGRSHEVITGIAVSGPGGKASTTVCTKVVWRALSEREITNYVATGEPLDKAGGYGIQGGGADFVVSLTGSRENVIGLPVAIALEMLSSVEVIQGEQRRHL
jgi:septum formation protein